jgi:hypothetical protein
MATSVVAEANAQGVDAARAEWGSGCSGQRTQEAWGLAVQARCLAERARRLGERQMPQVEPPGVPVGMASGVPTAVGAEPGRLAGSPLWVYPSQLPSALGGVPWWCWRMAAWWSRTVGYGVGGPRGVMAVGLSVGSEVGWVVMNKYSQRVHSDVAPAVCVP